MLNIRRFAQVAASHTTGASYPTVVNLCYMLECYQQELFKDSPSLTQLRAGVKQRLISYGYYPSTWALKNADWAATLKALECAKLHENTV